MSLFKSIFDKLLGNKSSQPSVESKAPLHNTGKNDFLSRWEKERQENVIRAAAEIKDWLTAKVKEKGTLNFSWESGNDEAFIDFKEYNNAEQKQFDTLEMYIINALDIPDAGSFQMTGNGTFYIIDNTMKVVHSSVLREILDYDEQTDKEVFGNSDEAKGDVTLFTI